MGVGGGWCEERGEGGWCGRVRGRVEEEGGEGAEGERLVSIVTDVSSSTEAA